MPRLRRIGAVLCLVIVLVATPMVAQANWFNYAPIHANFRHDVVSGELWQDQPPGTRLDGNWVISGSTTIADIDGNLGNGREVVVGTGDATVNAFSSSGAKLWSRRIANCQYRGANLGDEMINAAPAVGDLNGDGVPEVVVGYGKISFPQDASCQNNDHGGVVALDGRSGAEIWRFRTPFDNMNGFILTAVLTTPALADTDGDGTLEVGFGSSNNNVYLVSSAGQLLWKYRAFDTIFSTPAFADVNGDGRMEMIIGTDFGPINCVPNNGPSCTIPGTYGFLYAFPTGGGPNQNREFGTGYLWRVPFDTVVNSSPSIGDLDGDGTLEIVIGSGIETRDGGAARGRAVRILDAATGAIERILPMPGQVPSTPALADLDGDGTLEIVAASAAVDDTGGRIVAYRADGTRLWESRPTSPENGSAHVFSSYTNAPVIADLDGNGSLEVAVTSFKHIAILRGDNGQQLTASSNGDTRRSLWVWFLNISTPAIGDLDNDGDLELASGGSHGNPAFGMNFPANGPGFVYAWGSFNTWLGSPPAQGRQPYAAPWPMYHGTARGSGVYPQLAKIGPLGALLRVGESQTFQLRIRDTDGGTSPWTITESDAAQIVQLSRASGSAEPVDVTLQAPATPGEYTATITVDGGLYGRQTINVSVTATSGNVTRVALPTVRR